MKRIVIAFMGLSLLGCKSETSKEKSSTLGGDSSIVKEATALLDGVEPLQLTLEQANQLVELPLACLHQEYPNKLNQVLGSAKDLTEPHELHPAFYGCFDWHSSVHAHWSLVSLLKQFPNLEKAEEIRTILENSLSEENIAGELVYFQNERNDTYERTYGWAWLLKLAEELHTWNDPLARELESNLRPLSMLMVNKFTEFLPKLSYPVRVGEHENTAFALALVHDFAVATENEEFRELIKERATDFYLSDDSCPMNWEPSGFDFLSPCLSEVDVMRRILPESAFYLWMKDFMPQLENPDFSLEVGEVSDRTDGKLVHLDGLNFSRSWVLNGLANQYPERYSHLRQIARKHIQHSLPFVTDAAYEGGHWLGSFAIYALQEVPAQKLE